MALPLIPFLTGAAIGAVATYIYKDEATQKKITEGTSAAAEKISATVSSGTEKVKSAVRSKKSEEAEAAPA